MDAIHRQSMKMAVYYLMERQRKKDVRNETASTVMLMALIALAVATLIIMNVLSS